MLTHPYRITYMIIERMNRDCKGPKTSCTQEEIENELIKLGYIIYQSKAYAENAYEDGIPRLMLTSKGKSLLHETDCKDFKQIKTIVKNLKNRINMRE